uniref:Uncharacterized protein n=1 Tax=Arundo donax TaxID=35708 RepID=A0A0A9AA30_ARUDO
MDIQQKQIN